MRKFLTLVASIILIAIISVATIINKQTNISTSKKVTPAKKTYSTISSDKKATNDPTKEPIDIYTYIIPDIGCTQIEYDTFNKINEYRAKNGLSKLEWSKELYKATTIRAKEISQKFSHTRPNGTTCFTVSNLACAENIAAGHPSSEGTVKGWINSKGHRENILSKNAKYAAISLYRDNNSYYTYYWVNLFGK